MPASETRREISSKHVLQHLKMVSARYQSTHAAGRHVVRHLKMVPAHCQSTYAAASAPLLLAQPPRAPQGWAPGLRGGGVSGDPPLIGGGYHSPPQYIIDVPDSSTSLLNLPYQLSISVCTMHAFDLFKGKHGKWLGKGDSVFSALRWTRWGSLLG